jgi:hypothetical protein
MRAELRRRGVISARGETRLPRVLAATSVLESLGRAVAVDFGFGAFLEKFENYFGALATRVLVGLMGAAVVAACLSLIGRLVGSALDLFDQSTKNRVGDAFLVLQLLAIVWAAHSGVQGFRRMRLLREERDYLLQAKKAAAESQATLQETVVHKETILRDFNDVLSSAELILDEVIRLAQDRGEFTPEQADLLLSLRNTGLEKRP